MTQAGFLGAAELFSVAGLTGVVWIDPRSPETVATRRWDLLALTASGCQVIPVSKITVGYLSGGSDLGETKVVKEDESVPFAGGSGAVVTMKPAGFLIDDGNGCRYIHAGEDPVDNLIDKASDFLKGFQRT